MMVTGVPSPQLTLTSHVSCPPGSLKLPLTVTVPPNVSAEGVAVTSCHEGATLFTPMLVEPLALAPLLSVTVVEML